MRRKRCGPLRALNEAKKTMRPGAAASRCTKLRTLHVKRFLFININAPNGRWGRVRDVKGRDEAGSCQRQNAAKMLSQRQRLILQLAKLSPLQLPSFHLLLLSPFLRYASPCHVKLFTAVQMTRTALALWFFIIYVINPSSCLASTLPLSLSRSFSPSLPCSVSPWLRRHARFRAFACVVHIWQHVACLSSPQLTNGCLSGENMFLRNFIRLHLDPRHSPFPRTPFAGRPLVASVIA